MTHNAKYQADSLATANKTGDYWSQWEIDMLFALYEKNFSLSQIAEALERTYYGVTKMHELGKKEATSLVSSYKSSTKRVLPFDKGQSSWGPDEW